MKKLLLLTLCAGSTLFVASALAGVKGPPPPSGHFTVVIENTLSDTVTPTMIQADADGAYVNGQEGVQVDATFINFWPRTDIGTRNVSFNHGARLDSGTPNPSIPTGTTMQDGSLRDPHMGGPYVSTSMQNMVIGASQCGTMFWAAVDAGGTAWRLANFKYNTPASGDANVSHVVVTRNTATTWTVESHHGQPACADAQYDSAKILHDVTSTGKKPTTTTVDDGDYYVPFRLTYTFQ